MVVTIVNSPEAYELMQRGWYLVDLRTPEEYANHHVPDSFSIPFDVTRPNAWIKEMKDTFALLDGVVIICADGNISTDAFYYLFVHQFECIRDVGGGMLDWVAHPELPLNRA